MFSVFTFIASVLFPIIYTIVKILSPIAVYVIFGITLMRAARYEGIKGSWLSWIPICNRYLTGAISDRINKDRGKNLHKRIILLVLSIVNVVSFIVISYITFGGIIKLVSKIVSLFTVEVFNISQLSFLIKPIWNTIQQIFSGTFDPMTLLNMLIPNINLIYPVHFCIILIVLRLAIDIFIYISVYRMFARYDYKNRKLFIWLSILFNVILSLNIVLPICLAISLCHFRKARKKLAEPLEVEREE